MDTNALINEMMKHGHTRSTAEATVSGRSGDSLINLWNEYMPNKIGQAAQQPQQTTQSMADAYVEAVKPVLDEEKKYAEKLFGGDNPFVFDELAAKQQASEQFDFYYSEMLNDYLENVGVTRESLSGDQKLLTALRTTPEGTAGETTRAYDRAVTEAEKGFAGKGMFFSGTKKRALGQAEVEREKNLQQLQTDVQKKQSDVFGGDVSRGGLAGYQAAGAFGEDVATEVGNIQSEQMKEYYIPRIMAYKRKYPSESDVLGGYVPEQYLRY